MARELNRPVKDPRGKWVQIYHETLVSPAYRALPDCGVIAFIALRMELGAANNGDLSLPLSVSRHRGMKHPATLAKGLRALQAVGLIAITRKGGCKRGGQRLPHLYRFTDVECYAMPKKFIPAMNVTNEWKRFKTISEAETAIKKMENEAKEAANGNKK